MAEITCEDCISWSRHEGDEIDERTGKIAIMCCSEKDSYQYFSDTYIGLCKPFRPRKPLKPKENKMFEKLRRRGRMVTMAWDLLGLGMLCYILNKPLFWLAAMVKPAWKTFPKSFDTEIEEWVVLTVPWDSGDIKQIVAVWGCAILTITTIVVALYGLDSIAAWWYGGNKKS